MYIGRLVLFYCGRVSQRQVRVPKFALLQQHLSCQHFTKAWISTEIVGVYHFKDSVASFCSNLFFNCLENTNAITEGRDVVGSILLVHSLASEHLSNHVAHDAHHSSTAVVELDIELAGLNLRVLNVLAAPSDAVVAVVLGGGHPGKLHKGEESKDLGKSGPRDGPDAVDASGHIRELEVGGLGQVAIEDPVVVVDNDTNDSSHGNTAVLALDRTTALEGLRLSLEPAKGIEDTEGLGHTKLDLADGKGAGGPAGLGRGEGGGRAEDGGEDSGLHLGYFSNDRTEM
mmetsp:Transcript_19649/g.36913  ORF Transcript_19649/g.36913 Transcript_19649/m.36913 type:complete len:286 (-) Transcript_19649:56-913(-)